ncbi:REP-associated tyrosine transposase [Skermanella stibiiresistens]|uniref:REP-associated tyrosine transposase n=1 Tax=Skermanella stibiiresistens TaxID=913326 RepID=UPI000A0776F7
MRYRRDRTPGASYFSTVVTKKRVPVFDTAIQVDLLRAAFRDVKRERPFTVTAIVVLPDHLHALWTLPGGDADYSTRWQMIKARSSRRIGHSVWQGRFWERRIRDDNDLSRHIDYIHWNPVKHRLVQEPDEWPWSSFHKYQQLNYYGRNWCPTCDLELGTTLSDI